MMQRSESLAAFLPAFLKAQEMLGKPKKSAVNPHFQSWYAPLDEVLGAVLPALHAHGLVLLQPSGNDIDFEDAAQAVRVTTMILHAASGEWISADTVITLAQPTAQAIGSAITYGRRYGLALVGVCAEEDDDGSVATQEHQQAPAAMAEHFPIAHVESGPLRVLGVEYRPTKNPNVRRATVSFSDGRRVTTIRGDLASRCEALASTQTPLSNVKTKQTQWGIDLLSVETAEPTGITDEARQTADSDIPF